MQGAGLWCCGPGHGVCQLAHACSHHVVDPEAGAGPKHPVYLFTELALVVDVHPYMQHVRAVEGVSLEGHGQGAASPQRDTIPEAHPVAHDLTRGHILLREIDAGDVTVVTGRGEPRGASKATPDIQHALIRGQAELTEKILRGLASAYVKFVHRGKILDRHSRRGLAQPRNTVANGSQQPSACVVCGDVFV